MFPLLIQCSGSITGILPNTDNITKLMLLSNIDRLAAVFQTLHPDKWFDLDPALATASLDPFHQDDHNTAWTSDACRDWKASLKYDYDDLAPPSISPLSTLSATDSTRGPQSDPTVLSLLKRRINEKYGGVRKAINNSQGISGKQNDYVINVIYDR